MVRDIEVSTECLNYIELLEERVSMKFFQLLVILMQEKVIHSNFGTKLVKTPYYKLRIKAGNEYRGILFAVNHSNFNECTKAFCLVGFQKKSLKDYTKAIKKADKILQELLNN